MLISFFEEFPTKENLEKLKLVKWKTKLYVASASLKEFDKIKFKNKVYWPILSKKEGYWISPFSKRKALLRIFSELTNVPVMLDLELPKRFWLYFTFNFFRNKKLIRKFISDYKGKVYLAEYYPEGKFKEKIMKFFGLHFSGCSVIKMVYHSMHKFDEKFIVEELQKGKEEFAERFIVSFGTIALGINGNEPLLSCAQLEKDLDIAKRIGVKEVVIFRLGGLNKKYFDVLKKYAKEN